jgi:hypothetical protein
MRVRISPLILILLALICLLGFVLLRSPGIVAHNADCPTCTLDQFAPLSVEALFLLSLLTSIIFTR